MNTNTINSTVINSAAMNRSFDPIDRDLDRVAHDLDAVRCNRQRPTLLARVASRTWRAIVRKWRVQQHLQAQNLQLAP